MPFTAKLMRSKVAAKFENTEGSNFVVLDDLTYRHMLREKILEEAQEVFDADNTQDLAAEIGDVLDIIDCLIKAEGLSREEVEKSREYKRATWGGYEDKKFCVGLGRKGKV